MTCEIARKCRACEFINRPYTSSLKTKHGRDAKLLQSIAPEAQILPPIPSPEKLGYRTSFKLAVRPEPRKRAGRFRMGLFQPGTHEIGPGMQLCPLHSEPLEKLLFHLKDELEKSRLTPYREASDEGDLKYLVARSSLAGEILLVFVLRHARESECRDLVRQLSARGSKVRIAFMNLQPEKSNAILGKDSVPLTDLRTLVDEVNGLQFELGPTSFFQINRAQAGEIYQRITDWALPASESALAWDLFSGVGPISLHLARAGYTVLGLEENKEAVFLAQKSAGRNDLAHRTVFRAGKVESLLPAVEPPLQSPRLVVVNPSRRGIHESARESLKAVFRRSPGLRFAYLSCSLSTLVRDTQDLQKAGLKAESFQSFDLFAQTGQLEWLMLGSVDSIG